VLKDCDACADMDQLFRSVPMPKSTDILSRNLVCR